MQLPVWSVLLVLLSQVLAIPRELFYSYGPGLDQALPRDQDEVSSPEIELKVPIIFYGETYGSIYVNANGLLSFLTEIPSFFNIQFPLDYPVIAPLYTNVDTRGSGSVYYRETQDPQTLEKVSEKIRDAFSFAEDFTAKSAFIATWENVGYYNRGADKVNTYQVVITSDGTDSYVEMLYADNGIQWIQGDGHASGLPDARAQAGLVSGDGRLYTLRGSGTDQIQNLDKWSNIGIDGVWLFHVGQTGSTGNVMPPDLEVGSDPSLINTCATGATTCHSKASCIDYPNEGFCCMCQHGYYGNGLNCLKDGIPVRVNGKITGVLNGENLKQMDLQSYIVTSDGRTYTALSNVHSEVGYNMQVLNILGGVIGWQFARSVNKALNGYQLTGGVFNHTADITFPQTGDKITLRQRYHGLDVFDQLKMEAEVRGTLPIIPIGKKIHIADYEEQYTRTAPGVILSQSSQSFQLDGQPVDVPFTTVQTFQFDECPYAATNITTLRLKVARNFISYEAREKILRYGMTNKISPLGEEDPCRNGKSKCGEHSSCIVDGDIFKCVCNPGFQFLYEETEGVESAVCVDINECTTGTHNCDINAICVNEAGSFACQCKAGYTGDGTQCQKLPTCEDLNCHPNAECIRRSSGVLQCQCSAGFIGDGVDCAPFSAHETCDVANDCSHYATCTYDEQVGHYVCMCLQGYVGNGYICTEASYNASSEDSPPPQCLLGICFCPGGYELLNGVCIRTDSPTFEEDGNNPKFEARPLPACFTPTSCVCLRGYAYQQDTHSCNPVPGHPVHSQGTKGPSGSKRTRAITISCNIVNTCHPHAQCIYTSSLGRYQCHCNAGYEGDGYECTEIDVSCLQVDICDIHASCTFDESRSKAICVCNPGYQGDGTLCTPLHECSSPEDCGSNARCMWNSAHEHYECVCNPGFVKEGPVCITVQDSGCNIINDCDANAQCVYDPNSEQYHCRCNAGFSGDGKRCTPDPIGCNILNNCDLAADCVYDQGAAGYRCRCRAGFRGNGLQCTPELSCQQDPRICGSDATCIQTSLGQYECQCNDGFTGNGIICKATSKHDSNFLLLNQGMATLRIPYNPTSNNPGKPIAIQYYQMAIGIDIDCIEGRVYWSDITGQTIKSSKYDGTDVQNFLTSDIGSPEGISIDWVSRNVYWTDSSKDTIEVANLDTKLRKVLVSKDLVNPRGIAVHPARGKVFWSDWNRAAPKLEWANLDGTARGIFLQGPAVKLPNSLTIDFERDEVCWADAGSKAIECVGISTNLRRTVVANCSYPFGLAISSENYYWTDWNTQKIESAQRPSGKMNKPIHVPLGGSGKLYGIVSVPEHCPRVTNACQFESGSCGEGRLCLPNGHGGRSCVCADSDGEGSGEAAICNDVI